MKISKLIQKGFFLITHLGLLAWIGYVLKNAGAWKVEDVLYNFVGLSLYGGILIWGTAWWSKREFVLDTRKKRKK